MWYRIVLGLVPGLVLAGCGFRSGAASGGSDGGPGDAAIDGAGDGAGDGSSATPDCWAHWMDGSVAIDAMTVKEITELSSAGHDFAPWISRDGLRIYFSRDLTPPGHGDIYSASRDTPTGMFAPATPVASLNSAGHEGRVWLTSNELAVALATTRDGSPNLDMTARVAGLPFGPPTNGHLAMVNAKGSMRLDPFLTDDLRRLYFSADTGPGGKLQLWSATRASATGDFDPPTVVPGSNGMAGVNNSSLNFLGSALYQDERLLLFTAAGNGEPTELWYATRASAADGFSAQATKIPTVNTSDSEMGPVLSPDGCELYFASDRDPDAHLHLFHAQVTR